MNLMSLKTQIKSRPVSKASSQSLTFQNIFFNFYFLFKASEMDPVQALYSFRLRDLKSSFYLHLSDWVNPSFCMGPWVLRDNISSLN